MLYLQKILTALFFIAAFSSSAFAQEKNDTAIFAGGCFWCMEAAFEELPGVTKVISGYTGGHIANPTYEQVSTGTTGHYEAVQVIYDPAKVSYQKLLEWFWDNVDPTDPNGQFCDKGKEYAAGIFYTNDSQKSAATASVEKMKQKFGDKLVAFLRPAEPFYPAEDYHQGYARKNQLSYKLYHSACGRDETLKKLHNQ